MKNGQSHIYFKGLNGLRFFAALAVILTHVELVKARCGVANLWQTKLFTELGSLGVYFFFVLSGFLITYLLFVEREKTGSVNVKNFYLRRVFRIWPLYYLTMFLGFFVYPNIQFFEIPNYSQSFLENFWGNFWFYLFIFPNMAFSLYPSVPHIGQSWSIGVEEQFYLLWPWLIKKIKASFKAISVFIAIVLIIKVSVVLLRNYYGLYTGPFAVFTRFLAMSKLECMAIGGLGAYVLYYRSAIWLKYTYHKVTQIIGYLGVVFLLMVDYTFVQDMIHMVYSLFFLIIIVNVSSNPKPIFSLHNSWLEQLGKISYGIYMFHFAIVYTTINLMAPIFEGNTDGVVFNFLAYAISIGMTVLISWMSYEFIEKRFILKKNKFSSVRSGKI